jgi:hypothetical protein
MTKKQTFRDFQKEIKQGDQDEMLGFFAASIMIAMSIGLWVWIIRAIKVLVEIFL